MNLRRESELPKGPPNLGKDEMLLDTQTGALHYRRETGEVARVDARPYKAYVAPAHVEP